MKTNSDHYSRTVTFTATELSDMKQGVEASIAQLKRKLAKTKEPYLTTLRSSIRRLEKLHAKLEAICIEIEDQVLADINKMQKQ